MPPPPNASARHCPLRQKLERKGEANKEAENHLRMGKKGGGQVGPSAHRDYAQESILTSFI